MDSLPFDVIPIIFNFIKLIQTKRQFMKTCKAYYNLTKKPIEIENRNIVIKQFIFYVKKNTYPKKLMRRQPPKGRALSNIKFGFSSDMNLKKTYYCYICKKCGLFAQKLFKKNSLTKKYIHYCIPCKNHHNLQVICIPTFFKSFVKLLS